MTAEQWHRVRELFELAFDMAPGEVGPFLDREAGDDLLVRAEVASLLNYHSQAGAFLKAPAAVSMPDLLEPDGRDEPPALVPGQAIGSYTIVRELGRGGMGRVYLAHDARLGRTVALKAAPSEVAGHPVHRERLRREARAAAALTHPGICTVYALEELEGELYIASEYVDGCTLREESASARRPPSGLVLDTATELASALAAAHARGIVHRDLKPENIMRRADGRLKVLDFGLARVHASPLEGAGGPVTLPGVLVGTPAYMAPEQLNGEAADARADVFAFGVVLYEYAAGVHPFHASTSLAVAGRVLASDPEPLDRVRPDIPAHLSMVIGRCLQKAPAARYPDAGAIVRALADGAAAPQSAEASRDSKGIAAASPVAVPRTRWWRTHLLIVMALYVLAASLAWQVKEWQPGVTQAIFITLGIAGTVGGVFRGHLLFTEAMHPLHLQEERRRAAWVTAVVDAAIGIGTMLNGVLLARDRPLASVLTMALGIGLVLARFLVEPSTTRGAFGEGE